MHRIHSTTVGVLFCALLVSSQNAEAQEMKPHCIVEVDFNDPDTHTPAIKACAAKTVRDASGVERKVPIFFPCGVYWITEEVDFINVPLVTSFGCSARLIAHPKLGNQRMIYFYSVVGSTISYLELDGNKDARMRESMKENSDWPDACTWDDNRPANVEIHGSGIDLHNFASRNALCGAGLGVRAEFFRMSDSVVEDGGFAEGAWPYRGAQFADGITFLYCYRCVVTRVKVRNNTDLDIVFGGGGYNWIYNNECTHTSVYGFACFNWGQFHTGHKNPVTGKPWDGDHTGNIVENNIVFSARDMLGYGYAFGTDFFKHDPKKEDWLADVGIVRYNRSTGAKNNFSIDGINGGSFYGNLPFDARGTRTGAYNHCPKPHNFTAGHFGPKVRLQPGIDFMTFDGGVCKSGQQ